MLNSKKYSKFIRFELMSIVLPITIVYSNKLLYFYFVITSNATKYLMV